jgi:hypothetical protein
MGIPERRRGHDPAVNGEAKNRSVKLRGNFLLLREFFDIFLLSADLLPGGEGCDTDAEWRLHVTGYSEPDGVCHSVWVFRCVRNSLFISCCGINLP